MSRPNQMVTVGSGKERFSGPSALERLDQGSQARIKLIKAAKQAELARKVTSVSDLTSGHLTKRKLGLVAGGALLTASFLAACGGGEEEGQTVNPEGTQTPEPTSTVLITQETMPSATAIATQVAETPAPAPTPEPTPAPTEGPEEWSDETIAAKLYSAVHIANTVADLFPESEFLSTVKVDTETAFTDFKNVLKTKDYQSILTPLNGFGNVGNRIGQFACRNPYDEVSGKAWAEIKDLVLNVSLQYEKLGYIEEGMTETYKQAFFTLPEGCTNTIMLSSNN